MVFPISSVLLACFSTNSGMGKVWGFFLHMEEDASETTWADDAPLFLHASSGRGTRSSFIQVAHGCELRKMVEGHIERAYCSHTVPLSSLAEAYEIIDMTVILLAGQPRQSSLQGGGRFRPFPRESSDYYLVDTKVLTSGLLPVTHTRHAFIYLCRCLPVCTTILPGHKPVAITSSTTQRRHIPQARFVPLRSSTKTTRCPG
jgi:hypothetical protein